MSVADAQNVAGATQASVASALRHLQIEGIRTIELSASIDDGELPNEVQADAAVTSSYLSHPGFFSNRFEWEIRIIAQDSDELVGSIGFTLQVDYSVLDDFEVESHDAEAIATHTGLFAAYPYARELVHSIGGRLGLTLPLMPLLRREMMAREVPPAPSES